MRFRSPFQHSIDGYPEHPADLGALRCDMIAEIDAPEEQALSCRFQSRCRPEMIHLIAGIRDAQDAILAKR